MNKVLLVCVYCVWLLLYCNGRVEWLLQSPQYLLSGCFTESSLTSVLDEILPQETFHVPKGT